MYVCTILSYRIEGYEGVSVSEGQRKNILDRLKIVLYNVDILIKEESYEGIRSRITIDCCCVVCYSCISVQQLHPVHLRRIECTILNTLQSWNHTKPVENMRNGLTSRRTIW